MDPSSRTQPRTNGGIADPAVPVDAAARYELVRELGEGAMGTVWVARDRTLDRDVAIKLLHDRYLSSAFQHQLTVEARAMARLSHPNVVAVYDVGERDGRTFIAMELVRGEPLSAWLATPRPWREVVRVFRGVAAGLAAAHGRGLVHRDVKPSNILLGDDGRARLADFGVAHVSRAADAPATTSTDTAGPIGSPAYMAPERLTGDAAGARGDQFGFCATFYEALHGRRPFAGATTQAMVDAIRAGPPPPVRPVPRWLHAIVARGLAAEPGARFASMDALLAALRRGPRRRGALVAALALGGALATVGLTLGPLGAGRGRSTPAVMPLDAGVALDAAGALDAAVALDAGVALDAAVVVDAGRRTTTRAPDPAAGLTLDAVRARYHELHDQWGAAAARGDLRGARSIAERAIPFGRRLGTPEPYQVIMTMSCRLGDARRARAAFAKLPLDGAYLRQEMVRACRMHGMELGDLLE